MFTVKQLSRLAGVTPRTLHHYDAIGLLKPSRVGENGYRYYGEEALLRLQQILFYKELGLPLTEIKQIVGRHDFDVLPALEGHRTELGKRIRRLQRLVQTVDQTIEYLKGNTTMTDQQIFAGFNPAEQEKYAAEAEKMYDPNTVKESNRRWKSYTAEQQQRILAEGRQIYIDLAAILPKGASSPDAQQVVERWRKHMEHFWTPSLDQLLGLADLYGADGRFRANFDRIDPRLAAFMKEAVEIYVTEKKA